MKQIQVQTLNKKDFAPYGEVIGSRENRADMITETFDYWHNELNLGNFEIRTTCGWLDLKQKGRRITQLQRLPYSDEGYLSTDGKKSAIPVAPHDKSTGLPDYSQLKVFLIESGMGVLVHKNIWHWAPFPLGDLCTFVLLVRNDCFIEDGPLVTNPQNVFVIDCDPVELCF